MHFDSSQPWYHGSPYELRILREGSTITQRRELACIFSHKPTIVSTNDDGSIKHNGTEPGYLYIIAEDVSEDDVVPHPRTTMGPGDEWLTTRDLRLRFVGAVEVTAEELLSTEELEDLRRHIASQ